ncbi:MAG: UDP-N-acetylmuramate dehydrogenase [bacterium]
MNIYKNRSLKKYTTLGFDVFSKYFCVVQNNIDLKKAIHFAKKEKLKTLILGGGSNIVLTKNWDGIVILNRINFLQIIKENSDTVLVEVGAGFMWHTFVTWAVESGYSGIESLSLIPGTVGATPVQNVGAYGCEVKDTIKNVSYFDTKDFQIKSLKNTECDFSYRDSIFKKSLKNKAIIVSVLFELSKKEPKVPTYTGVSELVDKYVRKGDNKLIAIYKTIIDIRKSKLPDPKKIPNCGSFFKNPFVSKNKLKKIQKKFPDVPHFESDSKIKIPAGFLIDRCDFKGIWLGSAGIYHKNALVIILKKPAKPTDLRALIKKIQTKVLKVFDIHLEVEPEIVT